MKLLHTRFAGLIALIVFTAISFCQANQEIVTPNDKDIKNEANYLTALQSGNESLKINSAYMLGEIRSKKAVIPLMDMFRQERDEGAKLVAALSLLKIGDARGIFLVKRSIELKENDGITIILQHLYRDYSIKKKKL